MRRVGNLNMISRGKWMKQKKKIIGWSIFNSGRPLLNWIDDVSNQQSVTNQSLITICDFFVRSSKHKYVNAFIYYSASRLSTLFTHFNFYICIRVANKYPLMVCCFSSAKFNTPIIAEWYFFLLFVIKSAKRNINMIDWLVQFSSRYNLNRKHNYQLNQNVFKTFVSDYSLTIHTEMILNYKFLFA